MTNLKQLKQLLKIADSFKKTLLQATLFGSLGHLTLVVFTYFITLFFITKITTVAIILFGVIFALAILKGFFSYTEQLLNHYVAFKILHILRIKVMEKFEKMSIPSFTRNTSGDYMTIITTDIELLEVFYAHTITPFLIYIVQSVTVSLFLLLFNPYLALVAFAIYLVIGLVYPLSFRKGGEMVGNKYREKLSTINDNSSDEAYGIFETIQYGKLNNVKENLQYETDELITSSYKKNKFLIDLNFLNVVTYNLGVVLFIYVGGKYIYDKMTLLSLVAMFIVSFIPILYMGNLASTLSQTMASGKRFLELMNMPEDSTSNNNVTDISFDKLTVKNVSYSYDNKPVLSNINFSANKGEIVGIKGASGNGKSTLAKLIMKFIDSTNMDGEILIDGINLQQIDNEFFRNNSSIILQDSYLFNSSIKNNISFFEKNINKNKLTRSLENTNLLAFVNNLPKKDNEMIGERSSYISSGQKQRIAVARSLYADSKLLILDESTANIDVYSEIELLNSLKAVKDDKIIIIISHSDTTLSICDKIIEI